MTRIFLPLFLSVAAFAQPSASPYDKAIEAALLGIYGMDDAKATAALAEMEKLRPGHPPVLVYRELLASWRASEDPGNDRLLRAFDNASEESVEASELWTTKEPKSAEAWRYLASSYAQKAQFAVSVRPNWADAAKYGLKASEAISKAKDLNEKDPDIWVGIGAYDYFRANLPAALKLFSWMFVGVGNRERGLREIQYTIDHGFHSRTEAAMVLAGAYYSEGQYLKFTETLRKYITGPYPKLGSTASWEVGGCICARDFPQARTVVKATDAGKAWNDFQLGRIALAEGKTQDAEALFQASLSAPGQTVSLTTWSAIGRARAIAAQGKRVNQPSSASKSAAALADRYFLPPEKCPKAK